MSWAEYNKYIQELVNEPTRATHREALRVIMLKYFPKLESKSTPKFFHDIIGEMFKLKTSEKEGLKVLQAIYPIYELLYPNLKSRKARLSQIRKIIKKHQPPELYRKSKLDKYFNLNQEQRVGIIEKYKAEVSAKNKDKLQIDINMILEKMRELILSKNVYDKALALLLAYGGRPIELFIRNKFELVKGKPSWIKVLELAKKREFQKTWTTRPVVLFTPKQLISEITKLRNHFKGKILEDGDGQLSKDKSQTLNKRALMHFPFLKDVSQRSSLMRKIYADMAFSLFADRNKENQNSFIGGILGHEGIQTSFSYSWVNVIDTGAVSNEQHLNKKIASLEAQMQLMMSTMTLGVEPSVTPTPHSSPTNKKDMKIAKMKAIWKPGMTNAQMRKASKFGSKIVNSFMKAQKAVPPP
jgi:hypothetical protein